MELLEEHRCFEGRQQRWRHDSTTLNCTMTFSIFLPPAENPPVLFWLSGLTCNDEKLHNQSRCAAYCGRAGYRAGDARYQSPWGRCGG